MQPTVNAGAVVGNRFTIFQIKGEQCQNDFTNEGNLLKEK